MDGTGANLDASVSDTLTSTIITSLRQQYLEYSRREAEWSSRFGRDHLAVVNLRTRMRDIRKSIIEEVRRLSETARSDYEVAKQRQDEIEKQLAQAVSQSRTTSSARSTMRELETSAKSYRSLYESFLQRYMGAVQQETFPITEAQVISPASPPLSKKSKPKTKLVLAPWPVRWVGPWYRARIPPGYHGPGFPAPQLRSRAHCTCRAFLWFRF